MLNVPVSRYCLSHHFKELLDLLLGPLSLLSRSLVPFGCAKVISFFLFYNTWTKKN